MNRILEYFRFDGEPVMAGSSRSDGQECMQRLTSQFSGAANLKKIYLGAVVLVFVSSTAFASDHEFFAGVINGKTQYPSEEANANQLLAAHGSTYTVTQASNMWPIYSFGIHAGQWLSNNFGWEVGWVSLGDDTTQSACSGCAAGDNYLYSYSTTGHYAAALGRFELGRWGALFGKAGLYRATTSLYVDSTIVGLQSTDQSVSNTGLLIGGGYAFRVLKHLSIRPEIAVYRGVRFNNLDSTKPDEYHTLAQFAVGFDFVF